MLYMLVKGKLVLLFKNDLCVHNFNVSLLGHATHTHTHTQNFN